MDTRTIIIFILICVALVVLQLQTTKLEERVEELESNQSRIANIDSIQTEMILNLIKEK